MNNEELKREAEERARDFTDNKERQVAYECGFLDGIDFANKELKEKLAGAERTRDNLRQLGFPTFQSCKEYAELEKENKEAKGLLKKWQQADICDAVVLFADTEEFLKEE